jgi:hypothetical protein
MISHIITFVAGIAIGNITAGVVLWFFAGCREPELPVIDLPAGRPLKAIDLDEARRRLAEGGRGAARFAVAGPHTGNQKMAVLQGFQRVMLVRGCARLCAAPPFHGGNTGSIPVGRARAQKSLDSIETT